MSEVVIESITRRGQADRARMSQGEIIAAVDGVAVYTDEEFEAAVLQAKEAGKSSYRLTMKDGRGFNIDLNEPLGVMLRTEGEVDAARAAVANEQREQAQKLTDLKTTTATSFLTKEVTDELGVVTAQVVYGMHIGKDILASFRNITGGRAGAVEGTIKDAKTQALADIKQAAFDSGADGIVALSFDLESMGADGNMVVVSVSGTAVKLG